MLMSKDSACQEKCNSKFSYLRYDRLMGKNTLSKCMVAERLVIVPKIRYNFLALYSSCSFGILKQVFELKIAAEQVHYAMFM